MRLFPSCLGLGQPSNLNTGAPLVKPIQDQPSRPEQQKARGKKPVRQWRGFQRESK